MFLRRFSVKGYKNIRGPVVLDPLGPINVLHGANNVGKSNLLQAMALFFRCLRPIDGELPFAQPARLPRDRFADFVSHPLELFHLDGNGPVVLSAKLAISTDELAAAQIEVQDDATSLEIEQTLAWDGDEVTLKLLRFELAGGRDATPRWHDAAEKARLLRFARFLAQNPLVRQGPAERFALVGVRRDLEEDSIPRDGDLAPLALEMFDCRESRDTLRRDRWLAFVDAMRPFEDVLWPGAFEVTYQREEGKARLVYDTAKTRVPFRLLGTGVQQAAAVLGHILMRNASIVAIEEPELNLRWAMQERLREGLGRVVKPGENGALNQLFLSSHSPAFEAGDTFFLMEPGPSGPMVSRRPAAELPLVLGGGAPHLGLPDAAPHAYVTSQGIVRLPDEVIDRVHVRGGGGVVFPRAEPHGVRVVSNDDMLRELGMSAEDDAAH
jgi:hypothetical protein